MANLDALIHDKAFFDVSYIKTQQEKFGFTQMVKVETFLWDLELYGQLQKRLNGKVVLKGGAAAQLFVAPVRQRTSVDIDVIYLGDEATLLKALEEIYLDFGKDGQFFKFEHFVPKDPKTALPMETYTVAVPTLSVVPQPITVKIDFHLMRSLPLRTVTLPKAQAFVIPLSFEPVCISQAGLVGDKLLTLAQGGVGIPPDREDDIPKQLYDLDNLLRGLKEQDLGEVLKAEEFLLQRELKVRSSQVTLDETRSQTIELLERYSTIDNPKGNETARKVLKNFKGNYEPTPFRNIFDWCNTAKRIQFFVQCLRQKPDISVGMLATADALHDRISAKAEGNREGLEAMRSELLRILKEAQPYHVKRLRNAPLTRILWEAISCDNITDAEKTLSRIPL